MPVRVRVWGCGVAVPPGVACGVAPAPVACVPARACLHLCLRACACVPARLPACLRVRACTFACVPARACLHVCLRACACVAWRVHGPACTQSLDLVYLCANMWLGLEMAQVRPQPTREYPVSTSNLPVSTLVRVYQ